MKRETIEYWLRAALFVTISLTVLFIWGNSAATPVKSTASSDRVAQIIRDIFPAGRVENFLVTYIRKIAHFTEYSLLGIEVALLTLFIHRGSRLVRFLFSLVFGTFVALCDEGIQIFTGRGNSMTDVAIDVGGFFLFSAMLLFCISVVSIVKNSRRCKNA